MRIIAGVVLGLIMLPLMAQITMQSSAWRHHSFSGKTGYQWQGKVIKAISKGTASGLFYEQKIDLNKTPILTWRWKVEKNVAVKNQKTKAGDDFAARIYVVKKNKLLFWKTIALNYVWSNQAKEGSAWKNPYTSNAQMLVKQSGSDGKWHTERVNIQKDFKRYFGKTINSIDAIAIMTDTDNSKGNAVAYYADIRLLAE